MRHSRSRLAIALLAASAAAPVLAADDSARAAVEVVSSQRVPIAAGGTVSIDETWGEVSIEGWDEPAVEVMTTRRSAKAYPADEAVDIRTRLDRFAARVDATAPDAVSVVGLSPTGSVTRPFGGKSGVNLRYVIRVPHGSRLILDNGAGSVRIAGVRGDIAIDSDVGEVTIAGPFDAATAIDARSGIGGIEVNAPFAGKGELRRRALVGERFSYRPSDAVRRITVTLGVGSITIG